MNQVALVGNITDDPELRYTQSGAALAGFTVAVSHRSKHNGEWQDVNDGFFRCTAWRSVAENASRTLKKGMRVRASRSRSATSARTSSFSRPK
jgi:single-strand DNA-binding protein